MFPPSMIAAKSGAKLAAKKALAKTHTVVRPVVSKPEAPKTEVKS